MATPNMQLQNFFAQAASKGSTTFRVNTFALDGSALDVSSGYTLSAAKAIPAGDNNPLKTPISIATALSAAFDTTGFTVTVAGATLAPLMPTQNMSAELDISNDGGTTSEPAATGNLSLSILPSDA